MPPLLVLCTALRFFATGSLYLVLTDIYDISPASVCRCVKQVTSALVAVAGQFIKMPSKEALPLIKQKFYDIASEYIVSTSNSTGNCCAYGFFGFLRFVVFFPCSIYLMHCIYIQFHLKLLRIRFFRFFKVFRVFPLFYLSNALHLHPIQLETVAHTVFSIFKGF